MTIIHGAKSLPAAPKKRKEPSDKDQGEDTKKVRFGKDVKEGQLEQMHREREREKEREGNARLNLFSFPVAMLTSVLWTLQAMVVSKLRPSQARRRSRSAQRGRPRRKRS
jgi:hypothetical protein